MLLTGAVFSLFAGAGVGSQEQGSPEPLRVVLLAGKPDDHPRGTHEYEASARLLAHALESAASIGPVEAQVFTGGWPEDVLSQADTVVVITAGADRRLQDHPLLVGDRMQRLTEEMQRGCGLVVVHWSVFVPRLGSGERFLDWVGGHFDYESGPAPRNWASAIQVTESVTTPVHRGHPVVRGVAPFTMREEWYYKIRLAEEGLTPLLSTEIPGETEAQVVAWARERPDGGRGFATTGGHFLANFSQPDFQKLLLNAIVWTGGAPVPPSGVVAFDAKPFDVWIVTGHHHPAHDWRATSAALADSFGRDPRIRLRVTEDVEDVADLPKESPEVVVFNYCNWQAGGLSDTARHGLVSWLEAGGGLLLVHFANGAFHPSLPGAAEDHAWPDWYQRICRRSWDHAEGASGHDAYGPFPVRVVRSHPITEGLDDWVTQDELYYRQAGSLRIEPLVEARSKDTARSEPLAWAYDVGEGRVFQTLLGHDAASLRVPGTAALVRRAAAWCARRLPLDVPLRAADSPETLPTEKVLPAGFVSPEAWTPPFREGDPESEREEDWVDPRFQRMDTGPFLTLSLQAPRGRVAKALALRLGEQRQASAVFDLSLLKFRAAWKNRFLDISPVRFGLLRLPGPGGVPEFSTAGSRTTPLPPEQGRLRGLYLHGERVILDYELAGRRLLDHVWAEFAGGALAYTRRLEVFAGDAEVSVVLDDEPVDGWVRKQHSDVEALIWEKDGIVRVFAATGDGVSLAERDGERCAVLPPATRSIAAKLWMWRGPSARLPGLLDAIESAPLPDRLEPWTAGGPRRWHETVTAGRIGSAKRGYAVDTFTLPFENPWGALLFTSGVDFLPGGDPVVCTAHGDVWRVHAEGDDLQKLTWTRFATGLYQPLGMAVVDGAVIVLGRDQLTRLHDLDRDGEADFYESFCNQLDVPGDSHAFAMGLELDPDGFLYFQKSGGRSSAHGGGTVRVSPDGQVLTRIAHGFRHANGIGVGPGGIVTNADNQGEWIPATRINWLFKEDYYGGYRPAYRGEEESPAYDPPLCWIPHRVDNSAGGQVWVPIDSWGLPAGTLLHTSYGRCNAMLVLPEVVDGIPQGGVVTLPYYFESGVMRARFHPGDGQLYLTGLEGWQTAAQADGCLQRLRYSGEPLPVPTALEVREDGVSLRFAVELDAASVVAEAFEVERWNYLYSAKYGSDEWSLADPTRKGRDPVKVVQVRLLGDGRTIRLKLDPMGPVMQQRIAWKLREARGAAVHGELHHTIHRVGPSRQDSGS